MSSIILAIYFNQTDIFVLHLLILYKNKITMKKTFKYLKKERNNKTKLYGGKEISTIFHLFYH